MEKMREKIKETYKRLTKKHRLTVADSATFTEIFSMPINKLKFFIAIGSLFFAGLIIAFFILSFTPLKVLIPGFPSSKTRQMIVMNARAIDSLEVELNKRDVYLEKIKAVISGEIITDTVTYIPEETEDVKLAPMGNDTIFNELITPENYKFSSLSNEQDLEQINRLSLFTPIYGLVTNRFKASPGHFGTDIVGRPNAAISAILDGNVIFAEWSVTTGYVIVIQHKFNLISAYKHNSEVFVKQGDKVKTGELIALVGNEGEYSTGPHLHFELWQNGKPLNPENFFDFKP